MNPRPRRYVLVNGLLAVAASGCAMSDDARTSDTEIATFRLEQDLRIDGYEADLVPIGWLGVSPDGRIALIQGQDFAVRFFDAEGASLGAVGGEGEGPGELRRPIRAGWIDDTLWVSDTQLRRSTLIGPELDVVRVVRNQEAVRPAPADSGRFRAYGQPSPFATYGDGSTLVWAFMSLDGTEVVDGAAGTRLFRMEADGVIRRHVATIPTPVGTSVTVELGGGGFAYGPVPFLPRPTWTVSPSGSRVGILTTDMTATEPSYRVVVLDADGDTVVDRTFAFTPEPIPTARIDSAIAARNERLEPSFRDEMAAKMRAAAPSVYGEAEQIVFGSDDRIWIGMRRREDGTRWRVLSPTGELLGEVLLPPRIRMAAADADHIWCIERDEVDVESVVRYRM